MISILWIIGVITIVASCIIGIMSGNFWGFVTTFLVGAISSVIYFALARILENQEIIMQNIRSSDKPFTTYNEQKTCPKCQKTYDQDSLSCPHCGFRP